MHSLPVLGLGLLLALASPAPAFAKSVISSATAKRCDALSGTLRTEFKRYRDKRTAFAPRSGLGSAGYASAGAQATMRVGIRILPQGTASQPALSKSSQTSAFYTFRRKQFAVIAQMRRAGCDRAI